MSTGARLPLAAADRLCQHLAEFWGLDPDLDVWVGSVRRRRDFVGDLELVCRHEPAASDDLFARLARSIELPPDDSLFAVQAENPIGRAIKGLRPGFLAAYLEITAWKKIQVPVQIFRYTAANAGWITLMRTGPAEFGQWFLHRWKVTHGIAPTAKASIDGHLVDRAGRVIPVATEAEAFEKCDLKFVRPEQRETVAASVMQKRGA